MIDAMATIRLKYVTRDESEGVTRYYYRRPGQPKARLPGRPGSEEFMAAYSAALDGETKPAPASRVRLATPGTIARLVNDYYGSASFRTLATATQASRRAILAAVVERSGDKPVSAINEASIRAGRDARADTPHQADKFIKAMRHLMAFAVEYGLAKSNPAAAVAKIRPKTDGHAPWSDSDLSRYLSHHGRGSMATLAAIIIASTGLRVGDVATLGRQHIRAGRLYIRTGKTGAVVDVAMPEALASAIADHPEALKRLTLLVTRYGRAYSPDGLSQRISAWAGEAGLAGGLTAHGLRKWAASAAASGGASDRGLMALFGWTTPKHAGIYTRAASAAGLADDAAGRVRIPNGIVPPEPGSTEGGTNRPKKRAISVACK